MDTKPTRSPQDADKYIVRFPPGMRDEIAAAAKQNNRSMNAEIVARLSMNNAEATAAGALAAITLLQQQIVGSQLHERSLYADMGILAGTFLMCIDAFPKDSIGEDPDLESDLVAWEKMAAEKYALAKSKTAETDIAALLERFQMFSEQTSKLFPEIAEIGASMSTSAARGKPADGSPAEKPKPTTKRITRTKPVDPTKK